MNRKITTLILLFISLYSLKGQELLKEFWKIGPAETTFNSYAPDNSAEAVVIFDMGKSHFVKSDYSFDVIYERTTRIKIFTEAGMEWAEVQIPFYQEGDIYEKVYDLEANTFNWENGKMENIPFNPATAYDEKVNDSWLVKKFALPGVKPGSIIEYRYKIVSQHVFNFRDWEYQWRIPVMYSEYEVRMIPFYEYSWILQGASQFDSLTSRVSEGLSRKHGSIFFDDMIYKYIMKDIPAFNDEEFISSINDYIIKLDFQLSKINYPDGTKVDVVTTWEKLIKDLLSHSSFGRFVSKSEKLDQKLPGFQKNRGTRDIDKFDYVLNYVKANFNWNKSSGKYASKSPSDLVKEKIGNGADLNLFTVGLLRSSGIEAYPVLISTRENGKIKVDYPYSHFFNYTIIYAIIDGKPVLTDATEILGLNNRLPARCINDKGLIIKEGEPEWITLESQITSETNTEIDINLADDNSFGANIKMVAHEYDALNYRKNYSDNKETIKKKIESREYETVDESIVTENQYKKEEPYILKYSVTGQQSLINNKIYVKPFLNEALSDNPLKQKTRTYPIDMTYPTKRGFRSTITIPDGYEISLLPEDLRYNNSLFELQYSAKEENNSVIINFSYHFKKGVYSENDYLKIKAYFNDVVRKGNELVVLSKKQVTP